MDFLNLSPVDINPLMSECKIKVLYTGENRNGTSISKGVAVEMAKTLRGAPIVGYFNEQTKDFEGHESRLELDEETGEFKFKSITVPYGFVAPDAEVWFQKFIEDGVERVYLVTTGYLWTGQFPEIKEAIERGCGQSMELDEKTLDGKWAKNENQNLEFFIINDATFSKLCILGEDVEPCFEGASVSTYSLDKEFKNTLYSMVADLKKIVEGEKNMGNIQENQEPENLDIQASEPNVTFTRTEEEYSVAITEKESLEDKVKEYETQIENLTKERDELQTNFSTVTAERDELLTFKQEVEDAEKDALIDKFYMLGDEDKKDVIENKRNYSLDEIESKLAVVCYRKKISFEPAKPEQEKDSPVVTFNLSGGDFNSEPDWVQAVKSVEKTL
jgi:phage protein|nr:MAG TPA: hypothetical protein [Caudoviricetes sp.]